MNPWLIVAAICVLGISVFGGYEYGVRHELAKGELKMQLHLNEDSAAALAASDKLRAAEQRLVMVQNDISAAYEKGKKDAEATGQLVVADLRSGNLRLQNRWAGCEAARKLGYPATPGESGPEAGDREESAGRIVRAAAQCDAQVIGLQDAYNGVRDLVNKHGVDSSRR